MLMEWWWWWSVVVGLVVAKRVRASINVSIIRCLHLFTLGAWMSHSCATVRVEHHKSLGAHKYIVNYPYVTYRTCQWL
jgi:hypothetical protein